VAGAVLYGETVLKEGQPQLPFWIQNARVLDENNIMPIALFPAELIRAVIDRYHSGPRNTRIFNHSINASSFCRIRHMSAWAAEIDLLCAEYDILLVQSAGNLAITAAVPQAGVRDHLIAGRTYPAYLYEASARIANPAQSLQALTVGSLLMGILSRDRGLPLRLSVATLRHSRDLVLVFGMLLSPRLLNSAVMMFTPITYLPMFKEVGKLKLLALNWCVQRFRLGPYLLAMKPAPPSPHRR